MQFAVPASRRVFVPPVVNQPPAITYGRDACVSTDEMCVLHYFSLLTLMLSLLGVRGGSFGYEIPVQAITRVFNNVCIL